MPALLAPLVLVPAILLYRGATKWVAGVLLIALFVATVANPAWRDLPTEGAPVTLFGHQMIVFLIIVISSLDRGWLANTAPVRAVYASTFLVAFLVYYLFETQIVQIGPYVSSLVTFALLAALPWASARLWQQSRRSP